MIGVEFEGATEKGVISGDEETVLGDGEGDFSSRFAVDVNPVFNAS